MKTTIRKRSLSVKKRKKLVFTYELLSTSTIAQIDRENQTLKQREKINRVNLILVMAFYFFFARYDFAHGYVNRLK